MTRLRIGVAGLGIGADHARAFAATRRCELRWLCDLDESRARGLAPTLGGPRVTSSFGDLVADPEVDAVVIATYDDAHAGQVLRALEAGKHVFVEGPLCCAPDELAHIAECWRALETKRWLVSNLTLRAAPLWRWLGERIEEGALGRIYAFDGDYLWGRLGKLTDGWRGRIKDYSVLLGGGVHVVDLMLWLTGDRPSAVWASGNRICSEGTSLSVPDFAAATFEFSSGLIARVTANFGCVHPPRQLVRVFGTSGTFLYDEAGPRLRRSRDPTRPATEISLAPLAMSEGALVPEFVHAVLAGSDPTETAKEHFESLAACLAATRAVQSGGRVTVEYP